MEQIHKYKIVDKFFTKTQCERLIQLFQGEETEIGDDKYGRFDFTHSHLATFIEKKLQIHEETNEFMKNEKFQVNDKFYMNKYWPNSSFIGNHIDGTMHFGKFTTFWSIIIYLNDAYGGDLIVNNDTHVEAKEGRLVLLDQNTLHKGDKVQTGFKYMIRTDLIREK